MLLVSNPSHFQTLILYRFSEMFGSVIMIQIENSYGNIHGFFYFFHAS